MSWRLWNRETFCCDDAVRPMSPSPSTRSKTIRRQRPPPPLMRQSKSSESARYSDMPELSSSVESAPSDEEQEVRAGPDTTRSSSNNNSNTGGRPCIFRQDSLERYRGKGRHMTPDHLARIMEDIDRRKTQPEEWKRQSRKTSPVPPPQKEKEKEKDHHQQPQHHSDSSPSPAMAAGSASLHSSNDSQEQEGGASSLRSTHSVVRGFCPGRISSSYRSSTNVAAKASPPPPTQPKAATTTGQPPKKKPIFFLGSSSSPSDDDDLEENYHTSKRKSKHASQIASGVRRPNGSKRTSFVENVSSRQLYYDDDDEDDEDDDDFITDDDDDISESALEDESDWEDSTDEDAKRHHHHQEQNPLDFRRVDSRPNLVSRRSLLSTMLHEPDRAAALQAEAMKSDPVLRRHVSSATFLESAQIQHQQRSPHLSPHPQQLQPPGTSRPIIMTTSNTHTYSAAPTPTLLSPRTTRRNMLQTELTASLRQNLLWERQQKNIVAAKMQRRHTAHGGLDKVREYPKGKGEREGDKGDKEGEGEQGRGNSWKEIEERRWDYHAMGW
ncbi:DUF1752-domain-containing protein [Ascodesmis nigricans]|uniref:DUF1752-domain-containing protein n=1 Tax=Ascodesmis nigricans TaxID=341454 RepID=A0A4S2MRZ4_9PEZI|nr:DUF1752-domain-containing protein [Ascodesmis nigricans]